MKTKKLLLISLLIMLNVLNAKSQKATCSLCPDAGTMRTDKPYADGCSANFKKTYPAQSCSHSKWDILNSVSKNGPHPLFVDPYLLSMFIPFLENTVFQQGSGLRIYFAAYCKKNNDDTDPENGYADKKDNWLVPVFVPTVLNGNKAIDVIDPTGKTYYYIITPDGKEFKRLSDQAAQLWIANYKKTIWLKFNADLGTYNENKADTKSIWYDGTKFLTLLNNIKCQMCNNPLITAFQINFGAYENKPAKSIIHTPGGTDITNNISNQMTLTFTIPNATVKLVPKNMLDAYFDTGSPCPPAENCPNN